MSSRHIFVALLAVGIAGCPARETRMDSGMLPGWADIGVDALVTESDATMSDATIPGEDAGTDAGMDPSTDAGSDVGPDVGIDASTADAGRDAGPSDANLPVDANNDAGCTPLPTGPMTIMGTLPSGLTFNRPTACGTLSSVGTAVPYRAHTFCNTGGTRMVRAALNAVGGDMDPVLVLYRGVGAPGSLMCIDVDDDDGPSGGDSLMTASISAGETVTFVATTFDNTDTGSYALILTPL